MIEIIAGLIITLVMIFLTALLSKYFITKLIAATALVAIAFIYVGFALTDNHITFIVLEITTALVFFLISIAGYCYKPSYLAYGIILHGVWDMFHLNACLVSTSIPSYWSSFCCTVDLIYGAYLLLHFKAPANYKI